MSNLSYKHAYAPFHLTLAKSQSWFQQTGFHTIDNI